MLPRGLSHPLAIAARKRLCQANAKDERGIRSAPKEVLHIAVTEGTIDRALFIADALMTAVEKLGFQIKVDTNNGKTFMHCTENGINVEFSLKESVKRSIHVQTEEERKARERYALKSRTNSSAKYPSIPYHDYTPSNVLTLVVGSWPSKTWKDTPRILLENRIADLVAGVIIVAQEMYVNEQELKQRQLEQQRARERYEFITKRREAEVARLKRLEDQAASWERAAKLRAFADAFEQNKQEKGDLTEQQVDWLGWVRAKADGLDPLTPISDPILGAPEPNRYRY